MDAFLFGVNTVASQQTTFLPITTGYATIPTAANSISRTRTVTTKPATKIAADMPASDPAKTAYSSAAEREQLILEHMPQVRLIARRIHDRLPGAISLDDLISTGIVGLIAAIDRYDATQGVKLRTYAEYKIRGAILDSLRQMDWAPRQQRKRARLIESATAQLEQTLRREPTEEEVANFLGVDVEEYRDWAADAHGISLGSLDMAWDEPGSEALNNVSDCEQHWPSQLLEKAELQRLLVRAVERLPYAERTVLSLYYLEELTLREIAGVMNMHESRVSQLKSQGVARLRVFLDRSWPTKGTAKGNVKQNQKEKARH